MRYLIRKFYIKGRQNLEPDIYLVKMDFFSQQFNLTNLAVLKYLGVKLHTLPHLNDFIIKTLRYARVFSIVVTVK